MFRVRVNTGWKKKTGEKEEEKKKGRRRRYESVSRAEIRGEKRKERRGG